MYILTFYLWPLLCSFQASSPRTQAAVASIMETQEAQGRQDELSLGQEVPKRTIRIQSQRPDQEATVSSSQGAPHRVHQLGLHGRSLRGPGQRLSEGEMRVSWPQDFDF